MLRLTFRTKLLLAMMLVIAGVSVTTLLVTQRRVQANYESMFRRQFDRQISYFTTLQEARLEGVREQCLKLAQSNALITAMDQAETNTTRLYQIAESELREVLDELAGDVRGGRKMRAAFFRFLDARGKPLMPPETTRNRMMNLLLNKRRLESKLAFAQSALKATEPQQVGYLAIDAETNRVRLARPGLLRPAGPPPPDKADDGDAPVLQEVIVTKVVDPAGSRMLGALVLGFPLPDLVPQRAVLEQAEARTPNLGELIQTGILLDDRLYANTNVIPVALGALVAEKLAQHIQAYKKNQADFAAVFAGEPYRVFYELMNEHSAFPPAYQVCLYSMAEARREQRDLRWKILGAGAAALAVGLVFSLFISHGLTVPIRDLVAGTGEIRKGNFQVRVPVRSHDEVGQLTASFNEMAEGLAQKEKYRTVLNMVADEKVAAQLVAGELTLGGELREISVIFCDIRGFTALTQNMPPGEVIEMINEHMTALTRVVKEHHGVLDKFVGDLLMAIFGAPLRHGDDALNAARCALRLQEVRAQLNQTSRHRLQIGIGVATGTMVAGCMGSIDRLNYTVLGERVNLASRLCDRARAGEVLIDENTRQQLGEKVQVEPTGNIELKGFATPVSAFRLIKVNG